jgi:hypothetical protein
VNYTDNSIITFRVTRREGDRVWFRFVADRYQSVPDRELEVTRCPKDLKARLKQGRFYSAYKSNVYSLKRDGVCSWNWLDIDECADEDECLQIARCVAEESRQRALQDKNTEQLRAEAKGDVRRDKPESVYTAKARNLLSF